MPTARELFQLRADIEYKSTKLSKQYGVNTPGTDGYTPEYCLCTEYLLHEVAHYTTLGRDLKDLPKRNLSNTVTSLMEDVSASTGIELELDTLFVTRLAGVSLQMWSHRTGGFIVQAALDSTTLKENQVRKRLTERDDSLVLADKAARLALWFQRVKV
jgi:hypothetical protein